MIISCQQLYFSYLDEGLIHDISFHLGAKDKVALVGHNGAGKTTLFKLLLNQLEPTAGSLFISPNLRIGYLPQINDFQSELTLYQELYQANQTIVHLEQKLADLQSQLDQIAGQPNDQLIHDFSETQHHYDQAGGYQYQSLVKGVLQGLGFEADQFDQPINQLSGGQKTRCSLGKLLLDKPDLLLLDEPTNHLDVKAIEWLEGYLASYQGSLLFISHDRYFIDRIATGLFELENGQLNVYTGNYSTYVVDKERRLEQAEKAYVNQQKEIRRQEEVIRKLRSYNREKSIKRAKSREKSLAKMTYLDKPLHLNRSMSLTLNPLKESGNDIASIDGLSKSFDSLRLFDNLHLSIHKGEKVALIGDNGTGKTTLFRLLLGQLTPDTGQITLGSSVIMTHYDQEHQNLQSKLTVLEELEQAFPDMPISQLRNLLAGFLFTDDTIFKPISLLSGGEKGRLSLAKMMLTQGNFLLLDEPTNHLDLVSKEILENALRHYSGTVLFISHDRYFINRIATRIIELKEGHLTSYLGNYDDYIAEKAKQITSLALDKNILNKPLSSIENGGKQDWLKQKEAQSLANKRLNRLAHLEQIIHQNEQNINQLNHQLSQPEIYTNPEKSLNLTKQKEALEQELLSDYAEWENLVNLVE